MRVIFSTDNKIIGKTTGQLPEWEITEQPEALEGTRTPAIYEDLEFDRVTDATILQHASLTVNGDFEETLDIRSSDESRLQISGMNMIDLGNGGYADVYVKAQHKEGFRFRRNLSTPATYVDDSTGYVAGTLGAHLITQMEALLAGKTQSNAAQQYITSWNNDIDNPNVTINDNIFTEDLDFSGVSVMRAALETNDYPFTFPVTLVTQRHAMAARHVHPPVGDRVAFRRTDGTYQIVEVTGVYHIASGGDVSIVCFNENVTGTQIYPVMPTNWHHTYTPSTYLASSNQRVGILPTLRVSRHSSIDNVNGSYILVNSVYNTTDYSVANTRAITKQSGEVGEPWGRGSAIGGDSGGASFFLINGELVLISCQWAVSSSYNIATYIEELETAMNSLAGTAPGTYTFSYPDLSSFTTYT